MENKAIFLLFMVILGHAWWNIVLIDGIHASNMKLPEKEAR